MYASYLIPSSQQSNSLHCNTTSLLPQQYIPDVFSYQLTDTAELLHSSTKQNVHLQWPASFIILLSHLLNNKLCAVTTVLDFIRFSGSKHWSAKKANIRGTLLQSLKHLQFKQLYVFTKQN